jgi:hypothetical protein
MRYSVPDAQRIPAACVTLEDADLLEALVRRRQAAASAAVGASADASDAGTNEWGACCAVVFCHIMCL